MCTDLGELRSYLGLQITRDRAQRTITLTQSHMVQQVLQRFDFTYSSPQATPLSTRHSLSALPSDESVEPSGPYPELVGCLMYLMTCTRPNLAYPLSILACYVAPGRHRPEHMAAAKRVLRYFRLGASAWRAESSGPHLSRRRILGAMAAQELRWLTYLLTDLGEPPRSPPVLYVDNKAMLALCWEHRLEHRTKHIALRYFLDRELQQRGQLRLAYVASEANTVDIFTKALAPGDHQRFCTMLGSGAGGTGAVGGAAGVGAAGGAGAAGAAAGARAGGVAGVVARDPGAEGTGAVSAVSGGATWPRPYYSHPASPESRPASLVRAVRTGRRVPRQRPPPVPGTHSMTLRPSTAPQRVPLPSHPASTLPYGPDPETDSLRAASPTVTRFLATTLVDFAAACRLDYAASLVAESASASVCPPSVGGECALGTDVLEDKQEEFECFAAALPHLMSMLLAPEGDPDAPDIPTPRSYAEAIEGPYSSQW
ncbi:unnamed protein product [Closterium sp. NIES-54]